MVNNNLYIWFEGPRYAINATKEEESDTVKDFHILQLLEKEKGKFTGVERQEKFNKKRFTVKEFELRNAGFTIGKYFEVVKKLLPGFVVTLDSNNIYIEKK